MNKEKLIETIKYELKDFYDTVEILDDFMVTLGAVSKKKIFSTLTREEIACLCELEWYFPQQDIMVVIIIGDYDIDTGAISISNIYTL